MVLEGQLHFATSNIISLLSSKGVRIYEVRTAELPIEEFLKRTFKRSEQ